MDCGWAGPPPLAKILPVWKVQSPSDIADLMHTCGVVSKVQRADTLTDQMDFTFLCETCGGPANRQRRAGGRLAEENSLQVVDLEAQVFPFRG
eukprot:6951901-Karenia_brevis.AAC.1